MFSGIYRHRLGFLLFVQILLLHHTDSMWCWLKENYPGEGGIPVMDGVQREKTSEQQCSHQTHFLYSEHMFMALTEHFQLQAFRYSVK